MRERRLVFTDKTGWGDGPWLHEADKEQWEDEVTGLPCLMVRGFRGVWCGYVGVPPLHPWYERDYEDLRVGGERPIVHGGVTFCGFAQTPVDDMVFGPVEEDPMTFSPEPGEFGRWWLVGFDCGHGGDYAPETDWFMHGQVHWRLRPTVTASYRTATYVREQCRLLGLEAIAALEGGVKSMAILLDAVRKE